MSTPFHKYLVLDAEKHNMRREGIHRISPHVAFRIAERHNMRREGTHRISPHVASGTGYLVYSGVVTMVTTNQLDTIEL